MCLYPKLMKNRKYLPTKKNGGQVPIMDDLRKKYVPVGCGKCMECKKQRAMGWKVRIKEEIRSNKMKAYFMTYTFDDKSLVYLKNKLENEGCEYEGYKMDNEICKYAIRRYSENWRNKHGKSMKRWVITELGQTSSERIHMHGIVWTDKPKQDLVDMWKYGRADIGKKGVGGESAGYLVKYMFKVDEKHREYESMMFASKGIGSGYLDRPDAKRHKFKGDDTVEEYRDRKGYIGSLPSYWRNKLWNDEEREALWMKKLDEERRFVLGVEIDVSTEEGMMQYEEAVKRARSKNKRYGFGDDKIDVERRVYENKIRKIKEETRQKKVQYGLEFR